MIDSHPFSQLLSHILYCQVWSVINFPVKRFQLGGISSRLVCIKSLQNQLEGNVVDNVMYSIILHTHIHIHTHTHTPPPPSHTHTHTFHWSTYNTCPPISALCEEQQHNPASWSYIQLSGKHRRKGRVFMRPLHPTHTGSLLKVKICSNWSSKLKVRSQWVRWIKRRDLLPIAIHNMNVWQS